ncbi:MAG TPA: SusC/RagA family TonB-linked outer membrane protein [Puia sp.]|nr:SusC/RagA family TonB-linked outer membrane protein [Puia sp.]
MKKALFVISFALLAGQICYSQNVTVEGRDLLIDSVLHHINKTTSVNILFGADLFTGQRMTLRHRNASVEAVLEDICNGRGITYIRKGNDINIVRLASPPEPVRSQVKGQVVSQDGEPLAGATVWQQEGASATYTNADGYFHLYTTDLGKQLEIRLKGYLPKEAYSDKSGMVEVKMAPLAFNLGEVIVRGYGKTTPGTAIGSFSRMKASEIQVQPVSNVLAAMEGHIPGLFIRQNNGVPASAMGISLRGRNSILWGTDPLIIVDGVPMAGGNGSVSTIGLGSAQGDVGANAFSSIDPTMIASIEVLKDAAATAIYGSRGANGVILVTLKRGIPGGTKWNFDSQWGMSRVTTACRPLTTSQYLAFRKDAIGLDGQPVNTSTLPESLWGDKRSTDYSQYIMGNTAIFRDNRIGISGGDTNHVFLVNASSHQESSVFLGRTAYSRLSLYGNYRYLSNSHRLMVQFWTMNSHEGNSLPQEDLSQFRLLAPNAPSPVDGAGKYVWSADGVSFLNIPAQALNTYQANIFNSFNHLQTNYLLWRDMWLKTSLGYHSITFSEQGRRPIAAQDPAGDPTGELSFTRNDYSSTIGELTLEFTRRVRKSKWEALLGGTWQQERKDYLSVLSDGYVSDIQLNLGQTNMNAVERTNRLYYKYMGVFGRVDYNYAERYLLTGSIRRDGSSRFGPDHQFGNFWSLGGGWIFSNEPWLNNRSFLSFGKLRVSYGTTGNDQISENKAAEVFQVTNSSRAYQNIQGFYPVSFSNNNLSWELNRKAEMAIDLGLLKNRLSFTAAVFRNTTGNQLVYKSLSSQSGLPRVLSNEKIEVLNQGLELMVQSLNFVGETFRWMSALSITVPENRLVRFPGLATSTYAETYIEGKSLSEFNGIISTGVSRDSGVFTFKDVNGDGIINQRDNLPAGNLDPQYYGGLDNIFQYKGFELEVFLQLVRQMGVNPIAELYNQNPAGGAGPSMMGNVPALLSKYWRWAGDAAPFQRPTSMPGTAAATAASLYAVSSASQTDASFFRVKNVSLSYRLSTRLLQRLHLKEARLYMHGQNLFTVTHFQVTDPETQRLNVLPPMKTITAGIHLEF